MLDGWTRPNGLRIRRVRVPLGVVAIIYENRPNVTSDAAGLCLKSGNAAFLRGSSGAISSNIAVANVLRDAAVKADLPADSVILVTDTSREAAVEFMQQRDTIDCLIPRGGASLIRTILDHATVPYVIDGDGNCHVYVDESADLDMALDIVVNAKTQRPSVCNSAESLLVHRAVAGLFLPQVGEALAGVELLGDADTRALISRAGVADEEAYATEFLDLVLAVRVVDSLDQAIDHVNRYGTGHSEAIVTRSLDGGRALHHRGGRRRRGGERLHPLRGRRGVRVRGRDRHLHPEAPRPGPDGPARADHGEVRGERHRPDPGLTAIVLDRAVKAPGRVSRWNTASTPSTTSAPA